jgi:23S rRNA pseudouridine2604 synthase
MNEKTTSLNKFISQTGICSRREADDWIDAGRVKLNGEVARKGNRVGAGDKVTIDGKPLVSKPKPIYLLLNKPAGITCTTDKKDKDNIIDFMNYPERIFHVGRLDKASTGLIIMTNDGDIVNDILREEHSHEKEYIVRVDRPITNSFLQRMRSGVPILNTRTKTCKVVRINKFVFKIILTQGLNRQIRRMCEALDYKVVALKRVRIMNLKLGKLPVGQHRPITDRELEELFELIDIAKERLLD